MSSMTKVQLTLQFIAEKPYFTAFYKTEIPSRTLQFISMNKIVQLVTRLNSAIIAQSRRCSWISDANNSRAPPLYANLAVLDPRRNY